MCLRCRGWQPCYTTWSRFVEPDLSKVQGYLSWVETATDPEELMTGGQARGGHASRTLTVSWTPPTTPSQASPGPASSSSHNLYSVHSSRWSMTVGVVNSLRCQGESLPAGIHCWVPRHFTFLLNCRKVDDEAPSSPSGPLPREPYR